MNDPAQWDERYRTAEFVWRTEPNQFLAPEVSAPKAGRALDLACGEGRNAVWLATQGWTTTAVDFSEVGLAKAVGLADAHHVVVDWVHADATTWRPSSSAQNGSAGPSRLPTDRWRPSTVSCERAALIRPDEHHDIRRYRCHQQ